MKRRLQGTETPPTPEGDEGIVTKERKALLRTNDVDRRRL